MPEAPVRILAVSSQVPWPLDRGGHIRTYHVLKGLARAFAVTLVAGDHEEATAAVDRLAAAGVTCVPVRLSPRRTATELIRAARCALEGVPYVLYGRHDRHRMRRAVAAAAASTPFDVLYLDHLDSLLFAGHAGRRPVVFDMHNVYSLLVARRAAEERLSVTRVYLRREAVLLATMERRAAGLASAVFAVSEQERCHFAGLGAPRAFLIPNGVDCAAHASAGRTPDQQAPLVVFIGTMSWLPNASAARYLCTHVLPEVRRALPAARVRIVGRDAPDEILALARTDGVEVVGRVPDIAPHLAEASVLAVPLDAGGGTRLKIIEAFAAGLPVVSTAVGCEGIDATDGEHLLVAERERFAGALIRILSDGALAARLADNGRRLAHARYDWTSIGVQAVDAVRATLSAL